MSTPWIIIPTYQEADNLPPLIAAVREAAPVEATILVVDDNSPDGTGAIADDLAARHPDVRVLHRAGKGGLAGAYVAGFHAALDAGASHAIEMDADFSHDPADLPRLLAAAASGIDLVLGSRYVDGGGTPGWTRRRRWLSAGGGVYARAVLGLPFRDLTGGFRCFSASALRAIDIDTLTASGYAFQIETIFRAARAGCSVREIPIVFRERRHGTSKMSAAIAAEALWRVPAMRASMVASDRRRPAPHRSAMAS
jgi:dolichol-phosphate mannosyltransferase